MQNFSARIFLLLLSVAAHLCLIFAFGDGRTDVDKTPHQQGSVATTVELFKAATPDSVSSRKSNNEHTEEVDRTADHMPLSQTQRLDASETFEKHASDLATAKMQNSEEEITFLPVARPSEPYYFSMSELSQMPQVMLDLSPSLAFSLPNALAQLAVLKLLINEQGEIDQVLVDDSPLSETEQRLVIDTFLKTKFQPGKINEVPVKSQLKIEVRLDAGFDNH